MALKQAFLISLGLTLFKLFGFHLSGSMIVLASFYDSLTDSLVSYLNFIFYRKAREKADHQHPFGHGGFEVVSSLVQSILITILGCLLAWQSLELLFKGSHPAMDRASFPYVLGIMLLSAFSGLAIQWFLGRFEKQLAEKGEVSLTVKSDRAHYLSDFYTNGFGAIGLLSVYWLESTTLDSVLGLLGSLFLFKTAWPLLVSTFTHIMHVEAEPEVQQEILRLALSTDRLVEGIHRLRTRRLGPNLFVDFHLKLPAQMPLADAHRLGDRVEDSIMERFPQADVLIHLDPDNLPDEEV
ncbi:MAG TPA: cation diffusion facilitator family transporter [Oligoflexus sp.]|uniref:cation diffusion facilitator family transporter n=1 Tax=Oligoflexus sp. TaxID=1971216 RepID=UPI002D32555C|nr:cation diffusion facilitator family transporter [Oligoflexus sp.]HYX37615.1 cation diffusion facilitator family transporter [Oligoflexus sp.]